MSYPVVDLRGVRRPGAGPEALRAPATWLYGLGAFLHHALYDSGIRRARRCRTPVISIGSLTVGGAGKTPMTRWLAARLAALGRRPVVLSRGYRGSGGSEPRIVDPERPDSARDGDEPALLAHSLPDVPVVVGTDRVRAAAVAAGRGADVLVLDDGLQHRRLHRDADVVLWDGKAAVARRMLPEGPLREPRGAIRRADVVVLVERPSDDGPPAPPPDGPGPDAVFRARLVAGARQSVSIGAGLHALCGIADPESFERTLLALGFRVTGATRHADHHRFAAAEVLAAARRAEAEGADFLAVTAKDHVRWPRDGAGALPVPVVFDVDVEMEREDRFLETILALLPGEGP